MTGETHNIITMGDLAKTVTVDNHKRLVADLTAWLSWVAMAKAHAAKDGVDLLGEFKVFEWTDDGENRITLEVTEG